jgi:hypothetical protein
MKKKQYPRNVKTNTVYMRHEQEGSSLGYGTVVNVFPTL